MPRPAGRSGGRLSPLPSPFEDPAVFSAGSNAKAAGTSGGLGPARSERYVGAFETFAIGDELIRNPNIAFANLEVSGAATGSRLSASRELRDMLLGVDFLRSHRVFVAHSQRKMYFTYVGGPVFSP